MRKLSLVDSCVDAFSEALDILLASGFWALLFCSAVSFFSQSKKTDPGLLAATPVAILEASSGEREQLSFPKICAMLGPFDIDRTRLSGIMGPPMTRVAVPFGREREEFPCLEV